MKRPERKSTPASKAKAFIRAYCVSASITEATEAVGISRNMHYRWLREMKGYAEAFEKARDEAAQVLEDEAIRRATKGYEKAVYYQGVECGREVIYSDSLLQLLLKAFRPNQYRERVTQEITGKDGASIEVLFVKPEPASE